MPSIFLLLISEDYSTEAPLLHAGDFQGLETGLQYGGIAGGKLWRK
jgi:hypothetical protein